MMRAKYEAVRLQSAHVIALDDSVHIQRFFSQPEAYRFSRFRAFNGRTSDWSSLVDAEAFRGRYGDVPTDGQAGCVISHSQVIGAFADGAGSPRDLMIVAEDDALFQPAFETILRRLTRRPGVYDVAVLSDLWSLEPRKHLRRQLMATSQPSIFSSIMRANSTSYRFGRFAGPAYGTGLYLITREGARKYSEYLRQERQGRIGWLADDWTLLRDEMGLDIKILRPSLAFWMEGSSTRPEAALEREARAEEGRSRSEGKRLKARPVGALALRSRLRGIKLAVTAAGEDLKRRKA